MIDTLSVYLPMDRRHALARGAALPDRIYGAALFTDISGFTPLAEALVQELGPRRGAEELTAQLNRVYGVLTDEVHAYGGSVIGFSGDAITCWFDEQGMGEATAPPTRGPQPPSPALRAVACAVAMQRAIRQLTMVTTPAGSTLALAIKAAIVGGSARRFLVGDPRFHVVEVLAGRTLDTLAAAEHFAQRGEVVVDERTAGQIAEAVRVVSWREDEQTGRRVAVVGGLVRPIPRSPWPALIANSLTEAQVRPWLMPFIYDRLRSGQDQFLAELRPAVALMLQFSGIDYDQDDAGALLDAYIRQVQQVVIGFEGRLLDITMGDKGGYLYAVFGAPIAHEDDRQRAARAALELRAVSVTPEGGAVRIGISQGMLCAGAYGGPDCRTYGVLGDEVNLAARLMSHAAPGEVLVSGRVQYAAGAAFRWDALPAIQVKGKRAPVTAYRLLGAARLSHPLPDHMETADLIGRSAERAALADVLARLAGGAGGVVVIEGEPGIGKSRLVAELIRVARERDLVSLAGAGQSIEQQTAYRAWRDIFSAFFDLDEIADQAERRAWVETRVTELAPELIDRLPLLNDVLSLGLADNDLTRSLSAALRSESLRGLLIELLRAWATERARVLVLEDAHWLDSLSWELMLRLAHAVTAERAPLLLVVVARPLQEHHPAGAHLNALRLLPGATQLSLETLADEDAVTLAAARLGIKAADLPGAVAALVQERAGGNPFFAEELAAMLRDERLIRIEADAGGDQLDRPRCIVSGDLSRGALALPDTLQGLLLARMDRLPPEEQLTLKVAAVIGPTFSYPPLHYACSRHASSSVPVLHQQLELLESQEFIWPETPERLAYRFKHILTQEAAYQTLLYAQRRQLHRTVAEWYESLYEGENRGSESGISSQLSLAENGGHPTINNRHPICDAQHIANALHYPLLAHHYHYAENAERERYYAKLAGIQAADQYANAEAVAYFSRALELTPTSDAAGRYDLLLARERVYDLQGARQAQAQDLEALALLAEALSDDLRRAEVVLRQATYAEVIGDFVSASAKAQQAVALAAAADAIESETNGYFRWGRALFLHSDYAAARAPLEQALELARAAGLAEVEANSLRNLGLVALNQGDYAEARAYAEQAIRIFRALGDRGGESAGLATLGTIAYFQANYAKARADLEQSLQLSRAIGNRQGESDRLANLGAIAREQGDYSRARTCYEQALRLCREINNPWGEIDALNGLGTIAAYQGEYTRAQEYQQQALQICHQIGDQLGEGIVLANLGEAAANQGDYAAAHVSFKQAQQRFREAGDRRNEAWVLANLGLLLHHLGDDRQALDVGQQALRIGQDVGARSEQAWALTVLGHALTELGRMEEATDAYRQALSLRHALGEQHLAIDSLAGLVRSSLAQGDLSQAREHAEDILAQIRKGSLEGTAEPLRAYLTCYRILQASRDVRAKDVLINAYRLLQERAARIEDRAAQSRFLERVPAHRELLAEWLAVAGT